MTKDNTNKNAKVAAEENKIFSFKLNRNIKKVEIAQADSVMKENPFRIEVSLIIEQNVGIVSKKQSAPES